MNSPMETKEYQLIAEFIDGIIHSQAERRSVDNMFTAITHSHRTVQQSFWRTIQEVIRLYAEQEVKYAADARNMASYEWCKEVAKISDDHYLPVI